MTTMRVVLVAEVLLLAALVLQAASAVELGWAASPSLRPRRLLQASTSCNINPTICTISGLQCCGWTCADTSSNLFNCGGCGNSCNFRQVCCSGSCVDITSNNRHCGYCGNRCPDGVQCIYGMCNYA